MILRPYQHEASRATMAAFEGRQSALVVMATGLGKTVLFASIASQWTAGKVLILAHRQELIDQAADKVAPHLGYAPAVEMGDREISDNPLGARKVILGSVQTLSRHRRLLRLTPADFGLIIIDEAHHATARSYRLILDYFRQGHHDNAGRVLVPGNPAIKILGVTATPRRADEAALGQIFEHVAYDYGIEQAIADGWLVPISQRAITVEGLDFSAVRSTAGDLSEAELEKILTEEKHLHAVARPTIEMAGDRSALLFGVTVKHAEYLKLVLDRYKRGSAAFLSGESHPDERRETVEAFKAGKIQFLCNCGLFLEGFDAPNTAVVVMARPTTSLSLYMQVLGRGTRPLPGVVDGWGSPEERRRAIASSPKRNMLVLDFVGNSGKHKIVTAQDVLGGKYGEGVRRYAQKTTQEEARAADVDESLQRAADELALLKEEQERRRLVQAKAATYRAENVNPFVGGNAIRSPSDGPRPPADPATDKQVWYLVNRLGWRETAARAVSRSQASAIIGKSKGEKRA
jgi:superfamily II DNA or RNA helicase